VFGVGVQGRANGRGSPNPGKGKNSWGRQDEKPAEKEEPSTATANFSPAVVEGACAERKDAK
jgi:hypothetical protein